MGKEKGGFLSPKAIANRIKSKGLQKLRWFCQMCQKQCRDENGFKCHLMSEAHQRQLLLFADNPDKYIDTYSQDFEDAFLELIRRRFGTKRVGANIVYQEYIADKEHTHMNATQWETLTEFIKWLGREGKAVVDQTEKGWFIQYIDRDPEAIRKQEAAHRKEKMDLDDEEKAARFIQKQIERMSAQTKDNSVQYTELQRQSEDEKVTFSLGSAPSTAAPKVTTGTSGLMKRKSPADEDEGKTKKPTSASSKTKQPKQKTSVLEEIMQVEEAKKEMKNRKDFWLHTNIVVKIITKKLGEKYYKKKAVVKVVEQLYVAVVKVVDSGDKLRVDQAHLETVIPAIGKHVLVVNGAYRGSEAVLTVVDEKNFCCSIKIETGPLTGRVLHEVQYEDISKLA
ncbi:DNA/RNA-binding protein KIN17 [Lamellibrachia satsuma]|nr:DNA/RNA-binding protein KIN17 [Lamellibrachia satsuma]